MEYNCKRFLLNVHKMNEITVAEIFFLFFLFFKPLYLFPSGGLGIGDWSLVIAFLLILLGLIKRKKSIWPEKTDAGFWCFVVLAVGISGYYCATTRQTEFLKYALFWIYNGIFIWTLRRLSKDREKLLFHVSCVIKVNIIFQLLIWLSGRGRLFYEFYGTRYMGTFNDPNQMAFFLFVMVLLLYLYASQSRDYSFGAFYGIALVLILATKSVGILLGMMIFTAGIGILIMRRLYKEKKVAGRVFIIGGILVVAAGIFFLIKIWPPANFDMQQESFTILNRIRQKIWMLVYGGWDNLIYDRGEDKIWLYPQYLLYGAGEGGLYRFEGIHIVTEIHNSLLSILFCYGILPTILILCWIRKQVMQSNIRMWPAIAALLAESFFLVNYRQPFFWWILIYGSLGMDEMKGNNQKWIKNRRYQ